MSDNVNKSPEAQPPVAPQQEERSLSNQAWDFMKGAALGGVGVIAGRAVGEAAAAGAAAAGAGAKAADTVKGAAEGAIFGGVAGGILGGALGGKALRAAEAAAVGGVAGAVIGGGAAIAEGLKVGQGAGRAVGAAADAIQQGAAAAIGEAAGKAAAGGALGLGGLILNEAAKANKTPIEGVVEAGVKDILDTPKQVIERAEEKRVQTIGEVLIFGPIGPVIGTKAEKLFDKYFGK